MPPLAGKLASVMPAAAVVTATALALTTAPAAGAAKRPPARPDLVVSKGTVKVASQKVTGTFVVANTGRARAGRSKAALSVRASGRWRLVKRFALPALSRAATRTVTVSVTLPSHLPAGTPRLRVCADSGGALRERSESDNCRALKVTVPKAPAPVGLPSPAVPVPAPAPAPAPVPAPAPPSRPASSVPTAPIPFTPDAVFTRNDAAGTYWIDVPQSYDATHQTPITLFVWLHGCEGFSSDDIGTVAPASDGSYIAIAPDGAEGGCWDVNRDPARVLTAIADVKTHFNVNARRVIIGGYSSGGDLAYRTAFYNAYTFAGVLAENTAPFKDTGSTQAQSLAAAYWKFHVVHLAHTEDGTYDIDLVRQETGALRAAGFPVTLVERPGAHYDVNTDPDLADYLLPHLDDGWLAPP